MRFTKPALSAIKPISKVLVANRGEIACRVFRTAAAMGVRTVAVYCDAEPNAKHVQSADEAYNIGAPPAINSYLRGENIIHVAKRSGAEAIHPGYGFLSENAEFCSMVTEAGIEFIGPPPKAIIAMGSKSQSKIIMTEANVPVVPGYHGTNQSDDFLAAEAERIGYPLLIKAVSGGGGKGMKIIRNKDDFLPMLHSARREATNFFKDDRVLLERYIERPRHVEVQVFCDKHGNGVYFFERDCSVQRRYQKVLEEAPAPHLSMELRRSIGEVAVRAAKAVGYVGAGTVEFIFDTDTNDFFFMEMNTRLQVEHCVTEEAVLVKGQPLDLVRLQIRTAEGHPFDFTQDDITLNGHCIEARVFAESPRQNFLPGSGHLSVVREPALGRIGDYKVRLDTGFRSGDDVLVHYDPMIAKLIVWGKDRTTALRGLRRSLDTYHIVGINTNVDFCKACLENAEFQHGGVTTKFIEDHKETLLKVHDIPTNIQAIAAYTYILSDDVVPSGVSWEGGFRLHHSIGTTVPFKKLDADESNEAHVHFVAKGKYKIRSSNYEHTVSETTALKPGHRAVHVDGKERIEFESYVDHKQVVIMTSQGTFVMPLMKLPRSFGDIKHREGADGSVFSPMPGKIGKLLVPQGSEVKAGQSILILEAMKMEHMIKAPCNGTVNFLVSEGELVASDRSMAEVVPRKE